MKLNCAADNPDKLNMMLAAFTVLVKDGKRLGLCCECDTDAKTYRQLILHYLPGRTVDVEGMVSPNGDADDPYHYEEGTYDEHYSGVECPEWLIPHYEALGILPVPAKYVSDGFPPPPPLPTATE